MSSWIDRIAVENTLKLKDEFNVECFVETGTFYGVSAEFYSKYFNDIYTCEKNKEYYDIATKRLKDKSNISIALDSSDIFLKSINRVWFDSDDRPYVIFFLDAHDSNDLWTVTKELKSLEYFYNSIIIIHDFDCSGLGHLIYKEKHCNWDVIKEEINKINPNFSYYCNTKDLCDIHNDESIKNTDINVDDYVIDMIKYANSSNEKKYRGILYAVPKKIDLSKYKLVEFKHD